MAQEVRSFELRIQPRTFEGTSRLEGDSPKVNWPAASTIGDILKREGLVEARRRRRRAIAQGEVLSHATVANEEWSIDFKGWFRTADGTRCDPLTLTDAA